MSYYKYPRTYHLPFSEGYTSDDKILKTISKAIFPKDTIINENLEKEKPLKLSDWLRGHILLTDPIPLRPPNIYKLPLKSLVGKPVRPFRLGKGRKFHRYRIPRWMKIIERQVR